MIVKYGVYTMSESIRDIINKEINHLISEAVKEKSKRLKNEHINFNDTDLINADKEAYGDCFSKEALASLMKEPTFKFKVINAYQEAQVDVLIWLDKGLKCGTYAYDEDGESYYEMNYFEIVTSGLNNVRKLKDEGSNIDHIEAQEAFFEHYDNYLAERILLGQLETQTDEI